MAKHSTPFDEPPIIPTEPKKARGKIVDDPELIAMNRINRILSSLPDAAKVRVISWLKAKIEFPLVDMIKE